MKNLLVLVSALMLNLSINAQPQIEKSEEIDIDPTKGWSRVLLMKNDTTVAFHYGDNCKMQVMVFDKGRKQIANAVLEAELWNPKKMKHVSIAGTYEINGEAVVFLNNSIRAS